MNKLIRENKRRLAELMNARKNANHVKNTQHMKDLLLSSIITIEDEKSRQAVWDGFHAFEQAILKQHQKPIVETTLDEALGLDDDVDDEPIIEKEDALYLNKVETVFDIHSDDSFHKATYLNGIHYQIVIFPITNDGKAIMIPSIISK